MKYTKFLCTSDWHTRASKPIYRIDDYASTILGKIEWIVELSNKYQAPILLAGDVFHNYKAGTKIINRLTAILKKAKYGIYAVTGQHDLENHSKDLISTPYLTLMLNGTIKNLSKNPIDNIVGIGWRSDVEEKYEIEDNNPILVFHHCTTPGDPAFFLEEEGMSAENVLDSFEDFRYIITGDYHVPHVLKKDGRILINCGCIGRSDKNQVDFQPRVYLLDTEKGSVSEHFIPIKPSSEVFKIPENTKALDEEFSKHIDNILKSSQNDDEKPDFIKTVRKIMKDAKCTERQKAIAEECYNIGRSA